jgi:hypothetical protein
MTATQARRTEPFGQNGPNSPEIAPGLMLRGFSLAALPPPGTISLPKLKLARSFKRFNRVDSRDSRGGRSAAFQIGDVSGLIHGTFEEV